MHPERGRLLGYPGSYRYATAPPLRHPHVGGARDKPTHASRIGVPNGLPGRQANKSWGRDHAQDVNPNSVFTSAIPVQPRIRAVSRGGWGGLRLRFLTYVCATSLRISPIVLA